MRYSVLPVYSFVMILTLGQLGNVQLKCWMFCPSKFPSLTCGLSSFVCFAVLLLHTAFTSYT